MHTNKLTPIAFSPEAGLPVQFAWDDWCTTEGVSVASYTLTAEAGLTVSSDSRSGNDVTAWVEFAEPPAEGSRWELVCTITSTGSPARRDSRGALLVITRL